jgi:hypothetical protein
MTKYCYINPFNGAIGLTVNELINKKDAFPPNIPIKRKREIIKETKRLYTQYYKDIREKNIRIKMAIKNKYQKFRKYK